MPRSRFLVALAALVLFAVTPGHAQRATLGYYRFPALWRDTIIFTAEGDLWRVRTSGGVAERLTTHPGLESNAAVSPDGKLVAFSANYEGPTEVYTVSLDGGTPERQTWDGDDAAVVGWTKSGDILYHTNRLSTLPNTQLARLDPRSHARTIVPSQQASDGDFDASGGTLFFTRLPFQGSHTRRYRGGTAQAIWKYSGSGEAVPLTADYTGTSQRPMVWSGRVYFVSDRDGVMNIWSMDPNGRDLRQHTVHTVFDVQSPSSPRDESRISWARTPMYDIAANRDQAVTITLVSDFDQMRERWIKDPLKRDHRRPSVAQRRPRGPHRARTNVRHAFRSGPHRRNHAEQDRQVSRSAILRGRRQPLALSDESGEVEFWKFPANGIGKAPSSPPTRACCAGTACRLPTVSSSLTSTKISSSGSTTSTRTRRSGSPCPPTATSATSDGLPTASGWLTPRPSSIS